MPPIWIPKYEVVMERLDSAPMFGAEKRVAEALNEIKSSDLWIFHSFHYAKPREVGAAVNLEIDFLIVWKSRGFLILEVKGGRIEFDPYEKRWWRYPNEEAKSPVKQVEDQKNDLCSHILPRFFPQQDINLRNLTERALVFPDVNLSGFKDKRGQLAQRIDGFEIEYIADLKKMKYLPEFVDNLLVPCEKYLNKSKYIPSKFFVDCVNSLSPTVICEVDPFHILEQSESGIKRVTDQQLTNLKHILKAPALLMRGPAGSAKTVMGLSAILSWCKNEENAYYVTLNQYLVDGLRADERYAMLKDQIMTIWEFLQKEFDCDLEDTEDALIDALMTNKFLHDKLNVVIDEAQDISEELYEALVEFLPCVRLWVLIDSKQALERKHDERNYLIGLMKHATPYELEKNCRNVKLIAEHIANEVDLPDEYVNSLLPLGDKPPDVKVLESEDKQDRKLVDIIKGWIREGYQHQNIVIISCHAKGKEAVRSKYCSAKSDKLFNGLFQYGIKGEDKIAVYHVLDFRGLESELVIVTDIHGEQESPFRATYLAGSRAKFRLVMLRVNERPQKKSNIRKGQVF